MPNEAYPFEANLAVALQNEKLPGSIRRRKGTFTYFDFLSWKCSPSCNEVRREATGVTLTPLLCVHISDRLFSSKNFRTSVKRTLGY